MFYLSPKCKIKKHFEHMFILVMHDNLAIEERLSQNFLKLSLRDIVALS